MRNIFIVSQSGDVCVKVEKIIYTIDYNDETLFDLDKIYKNIYSKVYNYGSEEKCLNMIKMLQNEYVINHNCKKVIRIYVNGEKFAIYDDVEKGLKIYNKILNNIMLGEDLFDLRDGRECNE